jgi:Na+-driven multidrug efflux pump
MIWALGIPLAFLYFFFGEPLVRFFMNDPSASALQTGILFLRILSPFYPVVAAKLIADGILRGSGSMKAFMSATFTDLLLRVGMAFLLSRTSLGSTGIWCAWPVGWCIATLLSLSFYGKDWGFKKAPKQTE